MKLMFRFCTIILCSILLGVVSRVAEPRAAIANTWFQYTTFLSSYLGGSQPDRASAAVFDSEGNLYFVGSTESPDLPIKSSLFKRQGDRDAFVAKMSAKGKLLFVTYLGGSGWDEANDVALDSAGNAIVIGETRSADFPVKNATQSKKNGISDAFITKLSRDGKRLIFSTLLGGNADDQPFSIALDSHDNICLTGGTGSTDFPSVSPVPSNGVGNEVFITKMDAKARSVSFSTTFGGTRGDAGYSIAVSRTGDIYVTGITDSRNFPLTRPIQSRFSGLYDAFVLRVNPLQGRVVYSSYLGGGGIDVGTGISVDSKGRAYIVGSTNSAKFPVKNAFQPRLGRKKGFDMFCTKISSKGTKVLFSTYYGGGGTDEATGITLDAQNNIHISGITRSSDFPVFNALQNFNGGRSLGADGTIVVLSPKGRPTFSTFIGGQGDDYANGIGIDVSGRISITGQTDSTDFPVFDAFQSEKSGAVLSPDAFVTTVSAQ